MAMHACAVTESRMQSSALEDAIWTQVYLWHAYAIQQLDLITVLGTEYRFATSCSERCVDLTECPPVRLLLAPHTSCCVAPLASEVKAGPVFVQRGRHVPHC